jgi:hypothetical protein
MEQEWQAKAVAAVGGPVEDSQLEDVGKRTGGVVTYKVDDERLEVTWRLKHPTLRGASDIAAQTVASTLACVFGEAFELKQLHVVAAEDVRA